MIQIASSLDLCTILSLTQTSPLFSYLLCLFTSPYSIEQRIRSQSYTPLQYFVLRGNERVVIYLLECGADPNAAVIDPPRHQKTPLTLAIQHDRAHIVSLLLQYGAHVHGRGEGIDADVPGYTPLHSALMRYSEFQLHHPSVLDGFSAPPTQVLQIVQFLLATGADIATCTTMSYSPLHIACGTRDVDPVLIGILIAAGADIACRTTPCRDIPDTLVQPIHLAAVAGNTAVVQMLLSAGVDVEVETGDGVRPLDLAIMGMHAATVQVLVDVGADTSTRTGVECADLMSLDPFFLVGNTARWSQLDDWFVARGWRHRGHTLKMWSCQWDPCEGRREAKCGFRWSW